MRRRVLYICNTYYQVIVALQLSLTVHSGYEADLRLSDCSVGYREVAEGLRSTGAFGNVWTVETREAIRRGAARASLAGKLLRRPLTRAERSALRTAVGYDAIVFFNPFPDVVPTVDSSVAAGGATRLFRMEEGLFSCSSRHSHTWGRRQRVSDAFRPLVGKKVVSRSVERFYCFIPELCDDGFPLEAAGIPSLAETRDEIVPILSKAFGYAGFPYDQPLVFFGSAFRADGLPIGEERVVERLAEELGPETLVVKAHPRDGAGTYRRLGVAVMGQSRVPWEIVQLCEDLSGRALLSYVSGAPLTVTAALGDDTMVRFLEGDDLNDAEAANLGKLLASDAAVGPVVEGLHRLGLCPNVKEARVADALNELARLC